MLPAPFPETLVGIRLWITFILRNTSLLVLITLGACRFSKPLLRFDHRSVQRKDTLDKTVSNIDSYRCIRWDWNRGPHVIGEFDATRTYNEEGRLAAEAYTRRAISGPEHDHQKEIRRRVWHSPLGKALIIDRTIDKYHGLERDRVYHKTWIWDDDRKTYIKIDQRSNKPIPEGLKKLLPS